MFSNNVLMRHILLRIVDIQTSNRVVKIVKNVCYIVTDGYRLTNANPPLVLVKIAIEF